MSATPPAQPPQRRARLDDITSVPEPAGQALLMVGPGGARGIGPNASVADGVAPTIGLPVCGVHVRFLRGLTEDRPDLVDKDIGYIVENYVKPLTKSQSFADFALNDPHLKGVVNQRADYFVSYAWKYTLGTIVSALKKADGFVWMDFLVVNQHLMDKAPREPGELKEVLGTALRSIGKALVIVSPWDQPINTQRIWCVFELFMTEHLGLPVELLFAGEDKEIFKQTMIKGATDRTFHSIFGSINVAKAQATVPADRDAIMRLVHEFGEIRVNNVVMHGLKNWLVKTALDFGFQEKTEEGVKVMSSLAYLFLALGNLDDAQVYFDKALESGKAVYGQNSSDCAFLLNNAGLGLHSRGRYDEAELLFKEAITMGERTLGREHPDVATWLVNLATCMECNGKIGDVESLYKEAIDIHIRTLGRDHPVVANDLSNLAELYQSQARYEQAEPLYREAIANSERTLGHDHPITATRLNNLATCLYNQGKYDDAVPLFNESFLLRRRALGDDHPSVADSLNNLAACLDDQGKGQDAESLYFESLAIRKRALGADHPDVAQSLNNLAELYRTQARYDEAEPLYKEALEIWKHTLGAQHPDVATALNNYALCLDNQGKYTEAKATYEEAIAIRKRSLGLFHPFVAESLDYLAAMLSTQGKKAEAQKTGHKALRIAERTLGPNHQDTRYYRDRWGR